MQTKEKTSNRLVILTTILFLGIIASAYAETVVFEGTPEITNSSSPEQAFNTPVTGDDKSNYKCVITKEGKDYIWFSRDKKKLIYTRSGAFDYFVNPNGSGYVKITKKEDGKYLYMESLNALFKIITYWGSADKLEL